jgi:hypothetical protein
MVAESQAGPNLPGRLIIVAKPDCRPRYPAKNEACSKFTEIASKGSSNEVIVRVVHVPELQIVAEGAFAKHAPENMDVVQPNLAFGADERILGCDVNKRGAIACVKAAGR